MALTKATYGMISADTSTIDLNIDANTLYVDSSANRVGIGTNSPSNTLHVVGGFNLSGNIFVDTNVLATDVTNNRVGVNQASPSHALHVIGGDNDEARVRIHNSASGQASFDLDNSEGYFRMFTDAGTWRLYDQTDGAYRMYIDTAGNVGIGTTSPKTNLEVIGGLNVSTNTTSATTTTMRIGSYGASSQTYYGAKLVAHTNFTSTANTDLSFDLGALGEVMRLHCSGSETRVGIGETSPDKLLHLKSSGATGIVIESTTNAQNLDIDFYNNSGSAAGRIRYAEGTGAFSFMPNQSTEAVVFRYDGKVGIGTSTPAKPLHISSSDNQPLRVESTDAYAGIEIKDNSSATLPPLHSVLGNDHIFYGGHASARPEIMRVKANGYVGIGTTAPNYPLDVYGTDDLQMRIHRPSSSLGLNDTCGIGFSQRGDANTSTSDTRAAIVSTYNGSLHLCTEPGGNLNSNPVDHSALSIVGTDQNVGIGTTSPNHPLSVSAANAKIVAHSTADSQTIGFHAKYLDHATLYGSFEYTTGDAQLYIDNHFAGNNAAYSTINFRNCNNASNTLQTRMSIAGSTGMVTVNNRLRVANAGTATAGTVALEVLGNRNDSVVPANASAKFYAYSDGDGLALGNYTSSPYGSYLQAGYLLDSYGTAYNNGYPITLNPVGGNVGIGACGKDPLDILHIERSVNGAVQIQVDNQNTGNASYAGLYLNGQGNSFYIKNWGDSVAGKSNVTEFNTTASNQYMIFTPGNTHTLSLFNDESEFGSATADSKVTINPPNTSNAKTKTPTVIGFYHYYKTNPGANYAHMKTNFPTGGNTGTFGMIAIEATGYRYSSAQTIKGMWGFHNWNSGTYQSTAENLISSGGHDFCHSTYVSSDGYIVLVAAAGGAGNQYLGARLDFIDIQADYARHGTAYWPPAVTAISWSNNTTGVY